MAIMSGIAALFQASFVTRGIRTSLCKFFAKPIIAIYDLMIMRISRWLGKWIRYLNHRRHRSIKTKAILNSLRKQQLTQQAENSGSNFTEKPPLSTTTGAPTTRFGSGGERGEDAIWGVDIELGLNPTVCSPSTNEQYLTRILGSYEMAKSIASSCHFTDFRSLMRVSKALRMATLASMDRNILKQTTCFDSTGEGKSTCWTCGNQICASCKATHRLAKETTFHIENCSPYCGGCFRKRFCGRPIYEPREVPKKYWTPAVCLGHGSRESQVSAVTVMGVRGRPGTLKSPRRFTPYVYLDDPRDVCELCATAWREARSSVRIVEQNACTGCKKELKLEQGDLIWWACKMCDCECAEEFHQEIWDKGKRVGNHDLCG